MKVGSVLFYLGVLLAMLLNSCNSTATRSENSYEGKDYQVDFFDQIKLSGGYVVEITQTDEPSLVVKASEIDHRKIEVWVENNRLNVKTRQKNISTNEIKLEIGVNQLSSVVVEGGVFLTTVGYIELTDIDLLFQGGANVRIQTKANRIKVKAEGGVNIELEGIANELVAISEGAGNIDADKLEAKRVTCRVSGVGNATIFATDELNATLEGVGRIAYRGNPIVNKQVSGLGVIHPR
jgi:hypothetical protein